MGETFFKDLYPCPKIFRFFFHIIFECTYIWEATLMPTGSWQIIWKYSSVWNEHCRASSLRWAFRCVNSVVDVHYQRSAKRWEFPNFKQIFEHKVVLGQGNSILVFLRNKSQCWLITMPRSILPFLTRMKTFTYVWMFFQTNLSRQ